MIGWAWDGTAEGSAGCGLSDSEGRARDAAEAWLMAHPRATAVLGVEYLEDGATTLSAYWAEAGRGRRSRRLPDGRIAWEKIPAPKPGTRGR